MSQRQGPETQVGCSVRHRAQGVLDGVDALKNQDLGEVERFFAVRNSSSVGTDSAVAVDIELSSGSGLLIVSLLQHERLGQKHPGDAEKGYDDEDALDLSLASVDVRVAAGFGLVGSEEEHVDEGDEDGRGAAFGQSELVVDLVGVVLGPLHEHQQSKVAEEAAEEQQLRNELGEDVDWLLEVLVVPERDADAEDHVEDSKDDGNLHLEAVQKDNLVFGNLPNGIHSKRIGSSVPGLFQGGVDHVHLPAQDVLV